VTASDDPEIQAQVAAEIELLKGEGQLARIEPRCKICSDAMIRGLVNALLGMGLTKPSVVSALESLNVAREAQGLDRITYDNVYHHQKRHFDTERPAHAVYDAIIKKRAAESDPDFESGVGAEVNALSMLEIAMIKGHQNLVDEATVVPYPDGIKAAIKLHELTRQDAGVQQVAEVMARQNRIIAAIQEFLPPGDIPALIARIEGAPAPELASAPYQEEPEDVEEFDPGAGDEDDDDFGDD